MILWSHSFIYDSRPQGVIVRRMMFAPGLDLITGTGGITFRESTPLGAVVVWVGAVLVWEGGVGRTGARGPDWI